MRFQKYKFRRYSSKFPTLFKRERSKLRKILPKDAIIEHCGSSAVPGLGGKGMIDIFISVKKKDGLVVKKKLQKAKYIFIGGGGPSRDYFEKHYTYAGKHRSVHLHIVPHKNPQFKRAVAFVCYLKSHPKEKEKYAELKKKAVKHAKGEAKKYREYKHKFLQELGKKALGKFREK